VIFITPFEKKGGTDFQLKFGILLYQFLIGHIHFEILYNTAFDAIKPLLFYCKFSLAKWYFFEKQIKKNV